MGTTAKRPTTNEWNEGEGENQLHKSGEVVAVHVRSEGNPSVMHLAKPVELSVESEVLENAEDADQETENHPEPDETAPVLKRVESLHREKKEDQVRKDEQKLHPRAVGRRRAMKNPLAANDQGKSGQGRENRRKSNLFLLREINP